MNMRICTECNVEKDLTCFSRNGRWFRSKCKVCIREYSKNHYEHNKDKRKVQHETYYKNNKERINAINRNNWEENRDRYGKARKKWKEEHKGEICADSALRRAIMAKATPSFADQEKIKDIYKKAALISQLTGVLHHVDHIIPIRGKGVTGLHVEWNLRIIPAKENLRKNNKYSQD